MRELFFNKIFTLRNLFFLGNFLLLFLFLFVLAKDHFRQWKPYQKKYFQLRKEEIEQKMDKGNEEIKNALKEELKMVASQRLEVKQILATDLERVDRCTTCHLGYDGFLNPSLTNDYKNHPFAAPKNEIHRKHPPEKYGCTVCHEGQGLATTFISAGHMPRNETQKSEWQEKHHWKIVEFWEEPMKAGPLIYASCSKCHESHPKVSGMEVVKKGEELFFQSGCIGCHQIHGEGGTIAPDLAEETAVKPLTRIDFGHAISAKLITKNERTLENWVRLHLATAPSVLVPGDPEGSLSPDPKNPEPIAPSGMPYFGFNKGEIESLVAYVTSLKAEKVPYTFRVSAPKEPEPKFTSEVQHGRYLFQKYGCVGCHGKSGEKGISVFNKQGGRVPDLVKTVGTFTTEELIKKIQDGVNPEEKENEEGPTPPIYMPSFREKIKGQDLKDLVTYLQSIAEKEEVW